MSGLYKFCRSMGGELGRQIGYMDQVSRMSESEYRDYQVAKKKKAEKELAKRRAAQIRIYGVELE